MGGFAYVLPSNALDKCESPALSKSRLLRRPTSHQAIVNCLWRNPFIHPTVAIKRSALISVGGYNPELRTSQDYELWFRMNEQQAIFANLDIPLIIYRKTSVRKYKPVSYLRTLKVARTFLANRNYLSSLKLLTMTARVYYRVISCFLCNIFPS